MMDTLDMILFIFMFAAVVIGALLVFHGLGIILWWYRGRWEQRTKDTSTPWFRRCK